MTEPFPTPGDGGMSKPGRSDVIDAFMGLLAEQPYERIELRDVAARAGISLAELRAHFPAPIAILAAHIDETDRKVLAGGDGDMAGESRREKLFDILMRRLELLTPHRAAIRSLIRSAACNPALAMALNGFGVRSQRWMLAAADIDSAGFRGAARAQGLTLLFACVMRTWVEDEDPGLARTMAVLDRELSRGQRWAGRLDDFCAVPAALSRVGSRRTRRRRESSGDDPVAV